MASVSSAPPIVRTLGFDQDYGVLAFVDDKGQPRRLDLRAGEVRTASKEKLASLASSNGADIYGITGKGGIARITPAGDWAFEPPSAALAVFPQTNGGLVIAGNENGKTTLWLIQPPDDEVLETRSLPLVSRVSAQVGDRIYFAVDSGIAGVRARDLQRTKTVSFDEPVSSMVATPSGDRLYVAFRNAGQLKVLDRYSESVDETVELPGPVAELRMDPLGQYVLARPAGATDSAWVIGIGSDKVNGSVRTEWRADLPTFAPGSAIATVSGSDVVMVDASTFSTKATITGGAADFWYFMTWNGFRPRAADLDRPVTFEGPPGITIADSAGAATPSMDSTQIPGPRDTKPWQVETPPPVAPPTGYVVSFATVLTEDKAREAAQGIVVNGMRPRVMQSGSGGTTLYRVVLGPYGSRAEAERIGRDSKRQYWIYEEGR